MDKKNLVLAGVIASAVSLIVGFAVSGGGTPGRDGRDGKDGVGAVAGPEVTVDYFSVGGITTYYEQTGIKGATSTVCALRPENSSATTTIERFTAIINTGTAGTGSFALATSTDAYNATSTGTSLVSQHQVSADAEDVFVWSPYQGVSTTTSRASRFDMPTRGDDGNNLAILKPGQWLVWKLATSTPGGNGYVGRCSAVFQEI